MRLLAVFFLIGCFFALPAQEEGVPPTWEVEELGKQLENNSESVAQLLDRIRPKEWIQDGAPQAYVDQHEELTRELNHLRGSAQSLQQRPDRLVVVIETFLWMDRLQSMVRSFSAGVRKYQSGAAADLIDAVWGQNSGVMEQLKNYMRQLAVAAETEWNIVHNEAQRCRETLARQPVAARD